MSKKLKAQPKSDKTFFNFGVGWEGQYDSINCSVDWEKNRKKNFKGTGKGYRMFLIPVDDTGELINEEAMEIRSFRFKKLEKDDSTPESAPDYTIYTWEQ